MTTPNRLTRSLATLTLTLSLAMTPALARAQAPEEAPADDSKPSRPYDGYFVLGALAGMAMFIVGKTARRS